MTTWIRTRFRENQTLKPLLQVWNAPREWNVSLIYVTFCGVSVWLTGRMTFILLEIERYLRHDDPAYAYEDEHLALLFDAIATLLPNSCHLPEVIVYLALVARERATASGIDESLLGDALVNALSDWVALEATRESERGAPSSLEGEFRVG